MFGGHQALQVTNIVTHADAGSTTLRRCFTAEGGGSKINAASIPSIGKLCLLVDSKTRVR